MGFWKQAKGFPNEQKAIATVFGCIFAVCVVVLLVLPGIILLIAFPQLWLLIGFVLVIALLYRR